MSDRSRMRLLVLQVLIFSLLATLLGRLWFMQVVAGEEYAQAASDNRIREVVTPAVRGVILDARGRPLVQNRTTLVVSVDRSVLLDLPGDGAAVVRRLAKLLETTPTKLDKTLTLCGTEGAPPPPVCWNGSPYQPIPIAEDADPQVALQIMERAEAFPGVTAEMQAIRDYPAPYDVNAAQILGYLGPVTAEELDQAESRVGRGATLSRTDLVGRAGIEQVYDKFLRGKPGVKQLSVDSAGNVVGTVSNVDPTPGNYLVTNIDAHVQSVVEDELQKALLLGRSQFDDNTGRYYRARTGAAVVMEVDTGRVVAMASTPSYDPSIWVGGISNSDYRKLSSEKAGTPLINRAIQGQYAPASTWKVVTTAAAVNAGYSLYGGYDCPSSVTIGTQVFNNFESSSYGPISLAKALEVSCDTVFYNFAYDMWLRQGGLDPKPDVPEWIADAARGFGFGEQTGVDLPGEASGRIADREFRRTYYAANRDYYCNFRKEAPKDQQTPYLVRFAEEFCLDGDQFRAGDAVLSAIGQGDMLSTPLQMARAYAAIANGGTLYKPQIGRAVMSPGGEVVKDFQPKEQGKLPASDATISYLQDALIGVTATGTAAWKFVGFPLGEIPVASKTGTGEVYGQQTTSWFASYAPADNPKYVVLMMVPEGGTGSGTSAPSVRRIYEALFGIKGSTVDPKTAIIPGGGPIRQLPEIAPDGTIQLPKDDGLPGKQEPGIPATSSKNTKQNRRRARS
ncbi:MAG: penicillin-binding protein 2 [Actinomycetota bacterium]|nr:penicillin-binding protein 2 [Actinomycetota bacterium]MDH5277436.1 penicillin-binding protein 2 [Actinomycetota bacterium]